LIVGGVLAVVLLVAGLVAVFWWVSSGTSTAREGAATERTGRPGGAPALRPRSLDDPRVTQNSFNFAHAELTLAELEDLFGPGRKVSFEGLPLADRPTPGKENRAKLRQLAQKYRIRSWYLWTGKDCWVFAGFRTEQSSIVGWSYRRNGQDEGALEDSENTLP
jgi:hypothetical protein